MVPYIPVLSIAHWQDAHQAVSRIFFRAPSGDVGVTQGGQAVQIVLDHPLGVIGHVTRNGHAAAVRRDRETNFCPIFPQPK